MQKWKHRWHALCRLEQSFKPRGLVLLVMALALILTGYSVGYVEQWALHKQVDHYQAAQEEWHQERLELERELATRGLEVRMEQQSQAETREMMARQREQIQALETDLTFFRNIMAPEKTADGVQIHDFILDETADLDRFRFRLVLTQQKIRKRFVKGNVTLTLYGSEQGQAVSRDLTQLGVDGAGLKFSFRYFQQLEDEFTLPQGFVPERLVVQLRLPAATGQKASSAEISYPFADLVSAPIMAQLRENH
ncbi:DUF6776 family protein [Ferrimonas balearica]|uniref:DUF6776 family protein n=1 Tax=Ferrimonas balearica TaxID=44012 RepID=UPI001C938A74|nr:DUF6776 family protein [Ferrimonas balearica]MBY5980405.1 hypothetical protein [Ferrimonas balearica]